MAVTITDTDQASVVGTSSGGIALTAAVGTVVVVFAATGGDTTVGISDNRSHSYTASTKRVVPSGTISTITAYWTTVTTANPTVTVTRSTSGQLAVRMYVLDGATVTGISQAGNAAAGASSLSIGSVSGTGIALAGVVVSSVSTGPLTSVSPSFTRDSWQNMGSVSRVMETHTRTGGSLTVSASWSTTRTSAGIALIIPEASAPPATVTGRKFTSASTIVNLELRGKFTGSSIVTITPRGKFDGTNLDPIS